MIARVGTWEIDTADPRAERLFAESAWVPRSRREHLALVARSALVKAGLAPGVERLGSPAEPGGDAPGRDESLAAARAALAEAGLPADCSAPLALAKARHASGARRLLFLWRAGEELPFAVAKVARPAAAPALEREVLAHALVRSLSPETAAGAPPLLAQQARSSGLPVVVQGFVEGRTLARLHRERWRAGRWGVAWLAATGNWLGRFHAATARPTSRGGVRLSAVHGDAWSRNLVVRPRGGDGPLRLTCFVDWECHAREGDPLADLLRFVVASGASDLAGRGQRADSVRRDREALLRWLFLPGPGPWRAVRACLGAWREQADLLLEGPFAELAVSRLEDEALPRGLSEELLGAGSALR